MRRAKTRRRLAQTENVFSECRNACGRRIHFIRTRRLDEASNTYVPGAFIPCETELVNGDGTRTLVVILPIELRGRVVPFAGAELQGFEPHFGNCITRRRIESEPDREPVERTYIAPADAQLSLF